MKYVQTCLAVVTVYLALLLAPSTAFSQIVSSSVPAPGGYQAQLYNPDPIRSRCVINYYPWRTYEVIVIPPRTMWFKYLPAGVAYTYTCQPW